MVVGVGVGVGGAFKHNQPFHRRHPQQAHQLMAAVLTAFYPGALLTPGGAAGPTKKLGIMGALRDWHMARRFLVLAYAWMVVCM